MELTQINRKSNEKKLQRKDQGRSAISDQLKKGFKVESQKEYRTSRKSTTEFYKEFCVGSYQSC